VTSNPRPKPHLYTGDGQSDGTGRDRCSVCLMPKGNARHRVPAQPAAVTEFEARKLGEREPAEDLPTNVLPFRPRPTRTAGRKNA